MAAAKGNQYYLLAKNFTKPKSYEPQELWEIALQYFEWADKNPLKEEKVFGTGKRMTVSKMRAMTIIGFCNYANISRDTFNQYEKDEAYSDICSRIKNLIYQQKFEGAAADLLNPSIIARELGLADKQELGFDFEQMSDEDLDRIINKIVSRPQNI
ncbi:MAG TPA: terminase small subunit [Parafilimonas sp.]|nr:terminase small subunit [Parafilimonas sp.]